MRKSKNIKKYILIALFALFIIGGILLTYKAYASLELPKVYITVDDEEAFRNLRKSDGEKKASLVYDNGTGSTISSYIKIKVQGSTSAEYPKKNYTIKLYKDSNYSEKQKVDMGWGNFNKYCLKANWIDDKTHSRNIVTAKLAAKMQNMFGLFTDTPNNGLIDGFPIEIYLNNEFLGLYTWNIPKDSWMWNLDEDNPNHIAMEAGYCTDSTYFKEEISTLDNLATDTSANSGWEIQTGPETQATIDKFDRLISFVKDSTDEEFKNNFESYFNKDAMLNYLSIMYMAQATDNVAKNLILVTYDGNIWYPTLYDLDTTYGTHHRGLQLHENYYWLPEDGYEITTAPHANGSLLLKKVIRCFSDEFAERWFELRKGILSDENILKEFNNFIDEIPESTYALEATTWANSSWGSTTFKTIPGFDFDQIKDFLDIRLPYIDEIMYEKYTADMPATLSIKYSTKSITNKNVIATVVANRNDIEFENNPTTYTFDSNGTYTFFAIDGGGNIITEVATVNWIDKDIPEIEVNYSKTELTNEDITVTIEANEKVQGLDGWTLSKDKMKLTKIYRANASETITVLDIAGNSSEEINIKIENIDKIAPEIEVNYSKTELTNEDITVTLEANEKVQGLDGWTLSKDKMKLTKIYKANTSETITVLDIAGNSSEEINIKIENIDKIAPKIEVNYSKTELNNEVVTVTLEANEKVQGLNGWILSDDKMKLIKKFTDNASESIYIYDLAGNKSEEVEISVNNIDITAPIIEINYSEKEKTNKDVIVTITANKEVQRVNGWTLSDNKKKLTKTYTENTSETITIFDSIGNELKVQIKIENIDKTVPILQISYNETKLTNKNVIATITANEQIKEINGWKLSDNKKILTKTYTENTSETVTISDLIGNESKLQVKIENIDKIKPVINVSFEKTGDTKDYIKTTITANEEIQELEGWILSDDKKILTKTYMQKIKEMIEIKDIAGNIELVTIDLINIDITNPVLTVDYSNLNLTNEDVTVKITANEEIQEVEGWSLSDNKKSLTKIYINNTFETVTIHDLIGNESKVQVKIENIDKVAPKVELKISKREMTNEDVIVTITADEKIQELDGWKLSEDKKTLTKSFSSNTEKSILIKDLAGNVTTVNINLVNIDKVEPEIKLNYSEDNITNANVVVVITSQEEIKEVEGWILSEDKKTLTKVFEKNEQETIEVKDLVGNVKKIEINISNIDKDIPNVEVDYNNNKITNKDITVTITANEEIQKIEGWTLSENKRILTKTYSKNTQDIVSIKDLAGNAVEKSINISKIDKEKPIIETKYILIDNENVSVRIIANEEIQEIEDWTLSEDKKILTKTYDKNIQEELQIKDIAGNAKIVKIKIDTISKSETDKNELDKNTTTEQDKTISTDLLPNAGVPKVILIAIIFFSISLGVTIFKFKKYKGF